MSCAVKAPSPVLITLQDTGQTLHHASDSLSLLATLEANNLDVNYQCREGYCGACRASLTSGKVKYLQEPLAFIREGEVLLCCSQPEGDITLKINDI